MSVSWYSIQLRYLDQVPYFDGYFSVDNSSNLVIS